MSIQNLILAIVIGYLLGCIQSSYLLGMLIKKIDIRKYGTTNAGTSNAILILGWKYGIIVCLLDIFKGTLAIILVKCFLGNTNDIYFLMYTCGASVIFGHNFPFYMKLKGGKGTASLIGMLLAIDWHMALIGLLSLIIVTLISNYIAIGTIALLLSFCICTAAFRFGVGPIIISIALSLLSVYKHSPNIKKIYNHEELRIRKSIKKTKHH